VALISITEGKPLGNTPHVVDLGKVLGLFPGYVIANPRFRFWDTMGVFGLFVYLWFIYRNKWLRSSDYLIVGMLLPLITFLNPIYSYLFLRIGDASVLWRPAYLIPLPIVAGLLFVLSDKNISRASSKLRIARLAPFAILLVFAIYPFENSIFVNRTSKIPSLMRVDAHSGASQWKDLIAKYEELEKVLKIKRIISDQTTTFVLSAAVDGRIAPFTNATYFPRYNSSYEDDFSNSDHSRSLLIINRRNGKRTFSDQHAGHWAKGVLAVSTFYPESIDRYLYSEKNMRLVWSRDLIDIYLMPN